MAKKQNRRRKQRPEKLTIGTPVDLLAKGLPSQLQICAGGDIEFIEAAEGSEKLPTFTMVAYTGGRMRPSGFFYDVVLDLEGTSVAAGAMPILKGHDQDKAIGHAEAGQVKVTRQRITASGVISGANEHAREIVESRKNGFPWKASVGAPIEKIVFVDTGEKVRVNGRTFTGPLHVVRAATLTEISFVALAGDAKTSTTIAAQTASQGGLTMDFEKWLEAQGWSEEDLSDGQLKTLRAAFDSEQAIKAGGDLDPVEPVEPSTKPKTKKKKIAATLGDGDDDDDDHYDPVLEARAAARGEVVRQQKIRTLVAKANIADDKADELLLKAFDGEWDETKTELEVLRASRPSGPFIQTVNKESSTAVLEASLCMTGGMPEKIAARGLSEEDMDRAVSREHRGATLHSLMDNVIVAGSGTPFTGNRKSNDFIRTTMRAEREIQAGRSLQAAAGFTTLSLTGILGNVANKSMAHAFESVQTVNQHITRSASHSDFKAHDRYRLEASGGFKKVGPDGELKQAGLSEAKTTSQIETYGMIIALTRVMQFNDDLGAFLQIPTIIGRQSAIKVEEVTMVTLMGNVGSFFHANNNNLLTGAGSVLGLDGLDNAVELFLNQVDGNGKPALVSPKILLTGSKLKVTGDDLFTKTNVQVTTTTDKRKVAENSHRGSFTPHASPYLSNTAITDGDGNAIPNQSATKWFLFGDPADRAALVLATLNGQRLPTIESDDTDFTSLGMQWRGYHDFGVAYEESEAAMQSNGA